MSQENILRKRLRCNAESSLKTKELYCSDDPELSAEKSAKIKRKGVSTLSSKQKSIIDEYKEYRYSKHLVELVSLYDENIDGDKTKLTKKVLKKYSDIIRKRILRRHPVEKKVKKASAVKEAEPAPENLHQSTSHDPENLFSPLNFCSLQSITLGNRDPLFGHVVEKVATFHTDDQWQFIFD